MPEVRASCEVTALECVRLGLCKNRTEKHKNFSEPVMAIACSKLSAAHEDATCDAYYIRAFSGVVSRSVR